MSLSIVLIATKCFLRESICHPSLLHLDVTYNGLILSSNYHLPQGENVTACFPEKFSFVAPAELSSETLEGSDTIRIRLYESGVNLAQKLDKKLDAARVLQQCLQASLTLCF